MKLAVFGIKNNSEYKNTKSFIEDKGFKIYDIEAESEKQYSSLYLSEAINKVVSKSIDLLMIGGEKMAFNATVPFINTNTIKKSKVSFMGNGDATPFISLISLCNNPVYYGPNFMPFLSGDKKEDNYKNIIEKIFVKKTEINYADMSWTFDGNGIVKGKLIGGEINNLIKIWNTKSFKKINKGDIMLLDNLSDDRLELESQIAFLYSNGVFDKINTFIIGKNSSNFKYDLRTILPEFVRNSDKYNFVFNYDGMHSVVPAILRMDYRVSVNFTDNTVTQR